MIANSFTVKDAVAIGHKDGGLRELSWKVFKKCICQNIRFLEKI